MEQIIYLETDDNIPEIKDRLEWAQADRVLLVLPPKNHALRSLVNLKLLARHARNFSISVAVVTNDPKVIELSHEAKLVTFRSVERAQRSHWLSGKEMAPARPQRRRVATVDVSEVPGLDLPKRPVKNVPRPKWLPDFRPRSTRRIPWPLRALASLILLGIVGGISAATLAFVYPEGQVQLAPATQTVTADLIVRANPEAERIDYSSLDIPARLVQVDIRDVGRTPPATTDDLPADKARGIVTLVNRTDQEVTVPPSTTLTTSSGTTVRFLTVQTATIPAAFNAITQTEVIAVDPGPIGNVPAGQINRINNPVFARQVTVINEEATSGGTIAPVGVATRADKDRLQAIVLQQIQQEGYSQLLEGLAEQEFVPPESLIVIPLDEAYDPSLDGEVTDLLTLEMRAVVRGTAIGGQNANQLALAALQAQVPLNYRLDPRSLEFVAGEVVEVENRAVSFRVHASGMAVAQIDDRQVAQDIRGLPVEEAQILLPQQFPLAGEPVVTIEPDWLGRLPWFPFRINVTVNEPENP